MKKVLLLAAASEAATGLALLTLQAGLGVEVGDLIEAYATDAGVMADIPAWARSTGHELVTLEKRDDKSFRFVVKRLK